MSQDKVKLIRSYYEKDVISDNDCNKAAKVKNISDEMFKTVVEVFSQIDTNKSGSIDVDELEKGLRCVGLNLTRAKYQEKLEKFDIDKNGILDLVEFCQLCQDAMGDGNNTKEALVNALNKFDTKKTGFLTDDQVIKILSEMGNEKISKEEAKEIIIEADENKDGKLSIDEFANFLLKK